MPTTTTLPLCSCTVPVIEYKPGLYVPKRAQLCSSDGTQPTIPLSCSPYPDSNSLFIQSAVKKLLQCIIVYVEVLNRTDATITLVVVLLLLYTTYPPSLPTYFGSFPGSLYFCYTSTRSTTILSTTAVSHSHCSSNSNTTC